MFFFSTKEADTASGRDHSKLFSMSRTVTHVSLPLEPQSVHMYSTSVSMNEDQVKLTITWPNLTLNVQLSHYGHKDHPYTSSKLIAFIILKSNVEEVNSFRALGF